MRRSVAGVAVLAVLGSSAAVGVTTSASASPPAPRAAAPQCDPVGTTARFAGRVPTPSRVLGFELGSRQATNQEVGRYWRAADRASNRVVTGVYAHSVEGRPLRYALV